MSSISSKVVRSREKTRLAKERAKELKKLGVIHFGLKKTLTPQQKSAITRQYNRFADLINRPYDFGTAVLSKKRAESIKTASFVTGKGKKRKVWVYKKPNETIKWGRDGYTLTGTSYSESVLDHFPAHDEKKVRRLFASLKDDEFVMLRVGDNTPVRHTFHDIESFMAWGAEYRGVKDSSKWMTDLSVLKVLGGIPDHMEIPRTKRRAKSESERAARKAWKKTPAGRALKRRARSKK